MQTYGGVTQYVNVPVEIDENVLRQIASTANGQYYRATSNSKLKEVYEEIDKLERTKLQVKEFSKNQEAYQPFAWLLLIMVTSVIALKQTVLKTIP
jgi:Ca-activated chloride channel homolog